jgi:hypothetical protein
LHGILKLPKEEEKLRRKESRERGRGSGRRHVFFRRTVNFIAGQFPSLCPSSFR